MSVEVVVSANFRREAKKIRRPHLFNFGFN